MKKFIQYALLVLCCSSLGACRSSKSDQQEGLKIVTSFYPMYAMTKEVSGDLNDVRMIQSASGIHSFEPSPSDIQAIYEADVFFYHSHILEAWAGRLTPETEHSHVRLVEASKGVDLKRVEGLEDVEAGEGIDEATLYDPHTWLDPVLVAQEVQGIADELSAIDPKNAKTYQKNAKEMVERAAELTKRYQSIFKKCSKKTFVTQHTAFAYTASRFGLEQLGISSISEQEPTPRQLAEVKDFIETYHVKTIFVEKGSSDKLAKTLETSTKVKVKFLSPLEADPQNNKSFLENLEENLAVLATDLK